VTAPIELVIVERGGVRLGVLAGRISAIDDVPEAKRGARLQQQLGQPPLGEDERCFGLRIAGPSGESVVSVAGRVTIATVAADEISPLPDLLSSVAPVTAVVFGEDAPVLVLDADAMVVMVEYGRAI
jgi:hypothetical protein